MLTEARHRFPNAEFRILILPRKDGKPMSLRLKLPAEWLPNGRMSITFDAATAEVLASRDSLKLRGGARRSTWPSRSTHRKSADGHGVS